LFKPGNIGKLELKNRIIKAPALTMYAARDGSVTPRLINHYKEIALGGVGLIIVEPVYIDNNGSQLLRCQLSAADNDYIPGLTLLAKTIQENGSKACIQISHCGRQKLTGFPIKAPSRFPWQSRFRASGAVPEELTWDEIQNIVKDFGSAARRVCNAGFDAVEIHGAHGYLITNFLSPRTNMRTDWYGGSLENRMRFLLEVVECVKSKAGPDFPIIVRLSGTDYEPGGIIIEETLEVAKVLEKIGVNALHISGSCHDQMIYEASPMCLPTGPHIWAAYAIKAQLQIPIIASGSITTPELAQDIIASGKSDFVSLARPLFADPSWVKKAQEERPQDIRPCIRCNEGCLIRGIGLFQGVQCTVNATLGREEELTLVPAKHCKKVAVIGGGPAGMEAARVCALRGHEVTLYEKRHLGGALNEASIPEFKSELKLLIDYFITQMKNLNVKVSCEEAAANTIKAGKFDAAIIAVGAVPRKVEVPGINKSIAASALAILRGEKTVGQKVIIIGGGIEGTELGLMLAEQGKEVVFTTRQDKFMADVPIYEKIVYQERLTKHNTKFYANRHLEAVLDNGVVLTDRFGNKEEISADTVVINTGLLPQSNLAKQLKEETNIEVYAIGDCVSPRRIFEAIHEGHLAGRSL
jgi:2,4-dienoyl-CoA reductase-like NADH-dependent reductase (Old Yellow Enzyme family)/thioredoxin reductase